MKPTFRFLMLPAVLSIAVGMNAAKVNLSSEPADKMTDVRLSHMNTDDSLKIVLNQLRDSLTRDSKRFLAPDQTLDIHFTNIDLAGAFEPWHMSPLDEVRFVRDLYVPRLDFDYKITNADGTVAAEGKENLMDPAFQFSGINSFDQSETRYEKRMLADWLRQFRKKANS